jgi:putative endonuclease
MAAMIMLPGVSADTGEWKRKLKALGIARRRGVSRARAHDTRRTEVGLVGEEIAARFLLEHGLTILDRNVRLPGGEIDLVAEEGSVLVFVEVRRRTGASLGTAAESVTARKRARVVKAARRWLARRPRSASREIRFDVVALDGEPPAVSWIHGAFEAES